MNPVHVDQGRPPAASLDRPHGLLDVRDGTAGVRCRANGYYLGEGWAKIERDSLHLTKSTQVFSSISI